MASVYDIMMGAQSGASSGWSRFGRSLGEAMGGGPQQRYDESMLRGHRVQRALMDAKKATMEYNSLASLEDTLRDALPPEQQHLAPYIVNAQRGGVNPVQGLQAPREGVRSEALSRAMQHAEAGDMDAANRFTSIAQQTPMRQAQVSGNMMFNPNVAPEAQTPQLTEYGSGQLANQAERTRGLNAASMASAMRSGGRRGSSAEPGSLEEQAEAQREQMLDDAAAAIWHDARLDDRDMYGLTEKDIRHALATRGEARDREGNLLGTFDVSVESLLNPPPDFSRVSGGYGGTTSISSPSGAMAGAPVTEPQTRETASSPMDGVLGPSIADIVMDGGESSLPDSARAQLVEGEITTFGNGQSWTLRGGRPVRVN